MRFYAPPKVLINIATGRNVLLLLLLSVTFTAGIMPALEADIKALSGGVGVIDLRFFYTPETARSMLEAYGPEGIRLYILAQWTVDLIYPIIGGMLFATCFCWLGERHLWWIGLLLTTADWLENLFITILLVQSPAFSPETAWVACFFTILKWSTVLVGNGLILFFGGKKLIGTWKLRLAASRS